MGLKTFIGGVHPFEGKELAENAPIKEILPKGQMVYPLSQHIGAPATPIVAVGDAVKKGQLIGKSDSFVSAPVHSPVSGKVIAIEACYHPSGVKAPAVVIENDGEMTIDETIAPPTVNNKQEFIDAVKNSGIVGLGGAGFPTHVKLAPKDPNQYILKYKIKEIS